MTSSAALEAELARWATDPELSSYAERRVQRRATEAVIRSPEWRGLRKKAAELEQQQQREPEVAGRQLNRAQVRRMVTLQLELDGLDGGWTVTNRWIDALYDEFDADGSGLIEDAEWDALVHVLRERAEAQLAAAAAPAASSPSPRRHPSKPRSAAASSPKKTEALLPSAQLAAKTLKELRLIAEAKGVDEHAIEAARDDDEPRDALIALILGTVADPTQPEQKKMLDRTQVRRLVRLQLQRDGLNTDVTDRWIDALFDQFDADGSGLIDGDEWELLEVALPRLSGAAKPAA